MSDHTDASSHATPGESSEETRATGTRGRSRLTWLVAAAVVAMIAAIVVVVLLDGRDRADGPATSRDLDPGSVGGSPVTELTSPEEAATARCLPPTPELVSAQDVAFDGTLQSVTESTATFEVGRWYAGEETDLVQVRAPEAGLGYLIEMVRFEEGRRYLLAASEGVVTVCGTSGRYTPRLAALYDKAFAR